MLIDVLFWEFSWGLFQTSIEVEERLTRHQHWFKKVYRQALNIFVLCLILVLSILSVFGARIEIAFSLTNLNTAFFCVLSSVFYIWTIANIHKTLTESEIEPDNRAMWLFISVLFFYSTAIIGYAVVSWCFTKQKN